MLLTRVSVVFVLMFAISNFLKAAEAILPSKAAQADKAAVKLDLAMQLLAAEGFIKEFQKNIEQASSDLKSQLIGKNRKMPSQVYVETKVQFDAIKDSFQKESLQKLAQFLANKFSDAELKYLIDLSNNSLNKKFKNVLSQDDFRVLMEAPYVKTFELLKINDAKDAKTKIIK